MQIATNLKPIPSMQLSGLDAPQWWDTQSAWSQLQACAQADTLRTAQRRLHEWALLPDAISAHSLRDANGRPAKQLVLNAMLAHATRRRTRVLFAQLHPLPTQQPCLHLNDARGARWWHPLPHGFTTKDVLAAFASWPKMQQKAILVLPHAQLVELLHEAPLQSYISQESLPNFGLGCFHDSLPTQLVQQGLAPLGVAREGAALSPQLRRLQDESIHILREAVAEAEHPVMLYSIGKDSGVMLHLARKAFYPSRPPFALLHVDTRWKFQQMYLFRDFMAQAAGMELITFTNPEAVDKNINPFDHGSALHTDITKTQALKLALDHHGFDVVFGGARRDEEKSRAKERIFSFRTATHRWDPKNQRPELWNLFNTRKGPHESIRVFPLSNWTELDVWQYILHEHLPVVPLYFAQQRPVVVHDDMMMLVDDDRCQIPPGQHIEMRTVRFRTLGCYPLTGAVDSQARTVEDIVRELMTARDSERQGRKIDSDSAGSMEKKKQEGYF